MKFDSLTPTIPISGCAGGTRCEVLLSHPRRQAASTRRPQQQTGAGSMAVRLKCNEIARFSFIARQPVNDKLVCFFRVSPNPAVMLRLRRSLENHSNVSLAFLPNKDIRRLLNVLAGTGGSSCSRICAGQFSAGIVQLIKDRSFFSG